MGIDRRLTKYHMIVAVLTLLSSLVGLMSFINISLLQKADILITSSTAGFAVFSIGIGGAIIMMFSRLKVGLILSMVFWIMQLPVIIIDNLRYETWSGVGAFLMYTTTFPGIRLRFHWGMSYELVLVLVF